MKISLNLLWNARGVGNKLRDRPPTPYPFQSTQLQPIPEAKLKRIPESKCYIDVPIFFQTDMETETKNDLLTATQRPESAKEDNDMAGYVIRRTQAMARRHTI